MHRVAMAASSPLDLYLDDTQRTRATGAGTGETSCYPALAGVLNLVGAGRRRLCQARATAARRAAIL